MLQQQLGLELGDPGGQRMEHRRLRSVVLPLEDLVAQHQMIAKLGGGQLGEQSVILMGIAALRGEHHLGTAAAAQRRHRILDPLPMRRGITVRDIENAQIQIRAGAEGGERVLLLPGPLGPGPGEHEGSNAKAGNGIRQRQQGSAEADGQIVAVRRHQGDLTDRARPESDHGVGCSHTIQGRSPVRYPASSSARSLKVSAGFQKP